MGRSKLAEVPDLGAAAARERAAAAEENAAEVVEEVAEKVSAAAPQIVQAATAFIVLWIGGQVVVTPDLNSPIVVDHYPTADEILGAGAVIAADRAAERTASLTAQTTIEPTASLAAENMIGALENKQREAIANLQAAQQKAMGEALLANERSGKRG